MVVDVGVVIVGFGGGTPSLVVVAVARTSASGGGDGSSSSECGNQFHVVGCNSTILTRDHIEHFLCCAPPHAVSLECNAIIARPRRIAQIRGPRQGAKSRCSEASTEPSNGLDGKRSVWIVSILIAAFFTHPTVQTRSQVFMHTSQFQFTSASRHCAHHFKHVVTLGTLGSMMFFLFHLLLGKLVY